MTRGGHVDLHTRGGHGGFTQYTRSDSDRENVYLITCGPLDGKDNDAPVTVVEVIHGESFEGK